MNTTNHYRTTRRYVLQHSEATGDRETLSSLLKLLTYVEESRVRDAIRGTSCIFASMIFASISYFMPAQATEYTSFMLRSLRDIFLGYGLSLLAKSKLKEVLFGKQIHNLSNN